MAGAHGSAMLRMKRGHPERRRQAHPGGTMLSSKTQTVNRRVFISAAAATGAAAGAFVLSTQEASAMSASTPLSAQSGPSNDPPGGQDARQEPRPIRSTGAATFDG